MLSSSVVIAGKGFDIHDQVEALAASVALAKPRLVRGVCINTIGTFVTGLGWYGA